ncbi:heparan-alpha-glucosaminide N-acetyltransferase domain-containing protein [Glycomyces mayteni]|uniref:Heparan-alpha-glucosaminide N-acetyltransferase domain-containing protein n=1 Tax=Glycomyces mayteni TaxID=543887 RepID=A0ABW2D4L8_9ACTN|nr:heparan-alpha-glucosaminide N-acetyltransferase domain-containing protein [Glycomyces mayteni]
MTDTVALRAEKREPQDPALAPPPDKGPSIGRIVGLDAARAVAVFGMYYSHVGPWSDETGTWKSFLMDLPHGRSSALFATLAGLSLVLIAGGSEPKTGRPLRQAVVKIAIRAVLLLALGTWLTSTGTSIVVILAFYGLYFLLALPFIRLRARTLAILAAAFGLGGPILVQLMWTATWTEGFDKHDPLVQWGGDGLLSLLLMGTYPAMAWMAYILTGMALGRLDFARKAVRVRLAVIGPALGLLGYGGAWLCGKLVREPAAAADDEAYAAFDKAWSAAVGSADTDTWTEEQWKAFDEEHASLWDKLPAGDVAGTGSGVDWAGLTAAYPHSGTPFELAGNIGVAISVIVGLVALLGHCGAVSKWSRRVLAPLIAVGSMSLTVYVAHIAGVWFLVDHPANGVGYETGWRMWAVFCVAAMLFALIWKRLLKRGPLEWALTLATRPAKFVK